MRPPMPALPPEYEGAVRGAPDASPGWAQWLSDDHAPAIETEQQRARQATAEELFAEDPMAILMEEARRRAAQTKRQRTVRNRALAAAAAAIVALAGAIVAVVEFGGGHSGPQTAPTTNPLPAPVAQQPGLAAWCQEKSTPQLVSGSGSGDVNSGPGIILHLEYAWYVLRDPVAVRATLTQDAQAAPEQATRDAISAIPAGTKHCVTITPLMPDRWNVTVDEKHPDGSQNSWQNTIATTARDGQVRITSIVAGGR